jgi:hypothetical protein
MTFGQRSMHVETTGPVPTMALGHEQAVARERVASLPENLMLQRERRRKRHF